MSSFPSPPSDATSVKRDDSYLHRASLWQNRDFVLLWGDKVSQPLAPPSPTLG